MAVLSILLQREGSFVESFTNSEQRFSPLECEIRLDRLTPRGIDRSIYIFSFEKDNLIFNEFEGWFCPIGFQKRGIAILPLYPHVIFDYESNKDSLKAVVTRKEAAFVKYLRSYIGPRSFWLESKQFQKGILSGGK
jgi:hypothetical protein